jgi:hypothetical protein
LEQARREYDGQEEILQKFSEDLEVLKGLLIRNPQDHF